ncbi:MAG: hypothetical protein RI935_257 [Candidatus Parcubacteria bacterium]|jgi:hypothetical protein
MICRDCAIVQYQKDNSIETFKEAEIMRDRMFDINHKINESIYERMCYMEEVDPRTENKEIFEKACLLGNAFWNDLDKDFKKELEEERDARVLTFIAHDLAEGALDDFLDFAEKMEKKEKKSFNKMCIS